MEIKYFCSLGTLCHPARMMQRIHVKSVSYPFDWLLCDDNAIIDILNDDFNKFMDKSYYLDVAHKFVERSCGHSLYHEDFFFHKNPRTENDYLYYQRCINRFKNMMTDSDKKLFIIMYTPQLTKHPIDIYNMFKSGLNKEDIKSSIKQKSINLYNTLNKFTTNYKLLVVMNFAYNESQSFEMEYNNGIDFLTLNTISESNGVEFRDNMDNLFFSGVMCEHYLK